MLPVLVAGAVVAGLGQGASFRAGLQAVTGAAPADRRSEVSSSYFLVLYVAISIPVIGVGAGAQVFGLVPTAVVFAGIVALLAVGAFVSLLRRAERANAALASRLTGARSAGHGAAWRRNAAQPQAVGHDEHRARPPSPRRRSSG